MVLMRYKIPWRLATRGGRINNAVCRVCICDLMIGRRGSCLLPHTMGCLSAGRHSLRKTRVCSRFLSHGFVPLSIPRRDYAFTPTSRRMISRDRSDAHTRGSSEKSAEHSQAYPLTGYYSLILNSRSPYRTNASIEQSTPRPEDQSTSSTREQTPQEKMAIVFGTPLAGPGRTSRYNPGEAPPVSTWRTINGVPIPPQPDEPDNCCMSGCVNCVWDAFRDEMEEWAGRVDTAKAKAGPEKRTGDMRTSPRAEVDSASQSMDDDGGGSDTNWPAPGQGGDLFAEIPVGIREFMKTEKKLRVKHQKEAV